MRSIRHAIPAEVEREPFGRFEALLPRLKPIQAALLRRVEIQVQAVAGAAAELRITPNSASVTLPRARGRYATSCRDFVAIARAVHASIAIAHHRQTERVSVFDRGAVRFRRPLRQPG